VATSLPLSSRPPAAHKARHPRLSPLRYSVVAALFAVFIFLALAAPGFFTPSNLLNILVNNFAILAIVSLGMTLVISSGGIDLSVGTAIDISSLVFVSLVSAKWDLRAALIAGCVAAAAVGAFNALLIAGLRITPFLATLGTLFIGQSVQQLASDGGQPIYLVTGAIPGDFTFVGRGSLFSIPFPLVLDATGAAIFFLLLQRSSYGRQIVALGVQPGVARYSGVRVQRISALVYILSAASCGVAGIILSSTVKAYVPLSGNAYLLDSIGATFIGTTLHIEARPSIQGTLIGVLLLSVVANGLLLIGWNFYWQQVGTGVLIFLVLAVSFIGRRLRAGR
jgi:ribose transport system permease protein